MTVTAGRFLLLLCVPLLLIAFIPVGTQARMGSFGNKGESKPPPDMLLSSSGVEQRDHEITSTGLSAVFPAGFECEPIASPFASPFRYDGSKRRGDRNSGLHGGFDLSLKEGTPLLAVASGEVIARGEGGRLEGIFLWLRHAPADTGLQYWIFTKYQHLATLPDIKEGDRVAIGQTVALSGGTGTAGGHYGAAGYPHLHLSAFYGPTGEYTIQGKYNSMVQGQGAVLDDPLILYLRGINELAEIRGLPGESKKIGIGVVDEDGGVHPAGSATVWPVRCKQK